MELDIPRGEFFTSSPLGLGEDHDHRIFDGFETHEGRFCSGRTCSRRLQAAHEHVLPELRLFPHRSVEQKVALGSAPEGDKSEIRRRVSGNRERGRAGEAKRKPARCQADSSSAGALRARS